MDNSPLAMQEIPPDLTLPISTCRCPGAFPNEACTCFSYLHSNQILPFLTDTQIYSRPYLQTGAYATHYSSGRQHIPGRVMTRFDSCFPRSRTSCSSISGPPNHQTMLPQGNLCPAEAIAFSVILPGTLMGEPGSNSDARPRQIKVDLKPSTSNTFKIIKYHNTKLQMGHKHLLHEPQSSSEIVFLFLLLRK